MPIRVLPPEVAAKIAAGEVVERPASVVKELIENAIDAGATEIKIEVRQGGRRLIRVIDDGVGIPADEVELAFARYSTSKLTSVDDLARIGTLGFRGEALASIAAVSQLTMVTRCADEAVGTKVRLEGGTIVQRQKKGCPRGTVVTVENLFYNVPARLKHLRSQATERRHIDDLVYRYAMAFPELRFTLLNDGRITFQSTGSGNLFDVLIKVYGLEIARQMLKIEREMKEGPSFPSSPSSPLVHGYISPPSLHRANRHHLTFFVNRRWVQDRMLSYAVSEAYHTLLPTGRYPIVVLNIELDPAAVDVNVHPTKREVKFLRSEEVFAAVQKAVRRALVEGAPIPTVAIQPTPEWGRRRKLVEVGTRRGRWALEVQRTAEVEEPQPLEPGPPSFELAKLPPLRVLGQMAQAYIVAEGPEGMYLIDQHAAHERVLYERLKAERAKMAVTSQALLEPLTIELSPQQAEALEESLDALASLGFDIEPFGGATFLVRAVPAVLAQGEVAEAIEELIADLAGEEIGESAEERALISLACHSAVRAGQTLSMAEMRELVRQLEETAMPRTCPHGRPTMIRLSKAQLEREFGRR
ncbi:MAG TPA: DNA mismatch repair endonuclease MutL [Anaerolineae bacterium]|nr:DNA mismatch repair endonuclease MutL [Anaerolineae bacterium]